MHIEFSPEQSSFVELAIQEGRLRNPEDAMQQALALWVKRERGRLELLAEIEVGDNSPREFDAVLDSEEGIEEFFAGVEQRGLAKHGSARRAGD